MALGLKLDHKGMAAILLSRQVRSALRGRGRRMASDLAGIQAHDGTVDVAVDDYTSDRAVVGVTLAHAAGVALEAKHGYLTEAAHRAGLDVGGYAEPKLGARSKLVDYTTKDGRTRKATQRQVDNWTRGRR